ncbi:MAG: spore coat protein [Clostridiales bacterium]|nr:spore coat protein [Clostridiales bacterium]
MKQRKQDVSLNEKDALQDLLEAEKILLSYYHDAIVEGSCKPFRKEIFKNYTSSAETQFTVFEQMLARGYYDVQPAEKAMIDKKKEAFAKANKQIASGAN